MIDNVENVSRLSTKMNGDLILMVAVNRNNCSRPKIAGYTDDRKEKALKREEFVDPYCVFREYSTRDSTMAARRITRLPVRSSG